MMPSDILVKGTNAPSSNPLFACLLYHRFITHFIRLALDDMITTRAGVAWDSKLITVLRS